MVGGLWLQNYAAWRRILLQESFPLVQAILSIMNAIMTASAYHASSLARGRDTKGGGWTCWAGKESWTSGGEWHQDSKTQINQNQNSLLQPMRFVNRRIYMIPSICSEICWFSRYYNNLLFIWCYDVCMMQLPSRWQFDPKHSNSSFALGPWLHVELPVHMNFLFWT